MNEYYYRYHFLFEEYGGFCLCSALIVEWFIVEWSIWSDCVCFAPSRSFPQCWGSVKLFFLKKNISQPSASTRRLFPTPRQGWQYQPSPQMSGPAFLFLNLNESSLQILMWCNFHASLLEQAVSSVAQSCPTLCDPMNRSTPGLPVHHHLPEFTQTHVHRVSDAIQPSHPRSSPSPPAPNPSQHQSLFQWVNSSHEVAKVLVFQL